MKSRAFVDQIFHFGLRINDETEWRSRMEHFQVDLDREAKYPHLTSWYIHDPSGHKGGRTDEIPTFVLKARRKLGLWAPC